MHPDFQSRKKTWWWIESPPSYPKFLENPFAQGYELLRRIERFRNQLSSCHCPSDRTWKQLYDWQKDYFSLAYRDTLNRLSLLKRITAGPKGISFDASQTTVYLLKALEFEIRSPTLLACGGDPFGKYGFRSVPRRFQPHPSGKEVYTQRPTDKPLWEKSRTVESAVYLPLPRHTKYSEDRELTDCEVYAYFRNFIKDNPPPDFAAFRNEICRRERTARQENAYTLALGLVAYDYNSLPDAELKELADWLCRTVRGKNIFRRDDAKLSKAIYYAKDHVSCLIERAAKL